MFDVVVKGGLVIDGSGKAGYLADVGIRNGKISAIDRKMSLAGKETLDASGAVVAPGFVDMHSHTDSSITRYPGAASSLLQGITTEISGMCGGSAAPVSEAMAEAYRNRGPQGSQRPDIPWRTFAEFLEYVEKQQPGTNQAILVGQGTVRRCVLGNDKRYPTDDELQAMKKITRDALEQGAFGISTGRAYAPGCYGSFRELVEICRVAGDYNGVHSCHIQDQWSNVDWAVDEVVQLSKRTGVRGQVAHLKVVGKPNWGRASEVLEIIDKAQARGIDVMADVYPFTYAQVLLLRSQLPRELARMTSEELIKALSTPQAEANFRDYLNSTESYTGSRLYRYGLVHCAYTKEYEGLDLSEAAEAMKLDLAGAIVKLLLDNRLKVKVAGIMSEDDVRQIVSHPLVMIGTDAGAGDPVRDSTQEYSSLHPRGYATYPTVLGKYVRKEGALALEEAIKKMTLMPSRRCNIMDRGRIARGYWADIVVFDPVAIAPEADVVRPWAPPAGMKYVLVNGKVAVEGTRATGVRAGQVLRAAHHRMV